MSLQSQYNRLFEKTQGRSVDHSRGMIYTFPKYCKHCGKGMEKPRLNERRTARALFKLSFCTSVCHEAGDRSQRIIHCKPTAQGYRPDYPIEEMAFVSLEMKRQEEAMHPVKRLVILARNNFRLLSERLSFLELETGESWGSSKFYYWMGK